MISEKRKKQIEADTHGFTQFSERHPRIGQRRIFVYPNFGDPEIHSDYTAHRFHIVTVLCEADDYDFQGERMFKVQAEDGWEGSAWASELFPMNEREEAYMRKPASKKTCFDDSGI